MKTALKYVGAILLLLIAAGAIIYNFFPGTMVSAMQSIGASSSGLSKKSANIDGYEATYYEGGSSNSQTLVLLHGLGDDKNSFVGSVGDLSENYRVILPDLAAHGENAAEAGRDYSIRGQVEFIAKLMDKIGVETFHIGGNSMGGHIAAAFAARYPEKTRSLVVINATGMQLKDESVYLYYPEVVDRAFIDDMFSRVFANEPSIPDVIIDHMITELNPKIPFMNALIAEVEKGPDFRLNEQMANVTVPSYVLWGKEDPVVPVVYAEAFHAALPNSKIKLLENAGHSPQFEIADIVQSEIAGFLKTIPTDSKKKTLN